MLFYGNASAPIEMPDRLLAHVKVVMATKLRRSESFTLSWTHATEQNPGRSTIWLQPSIPLRFVFDSAEMEKLDQGLLAKMARDASSSGGLNIDLAGEPVAAAAPQRQRSLARAA